MQKILVGLLIAVVMLVSNPNELYAGCGGGGGGGSNGANTTSSSSAKSSSLSSQSTQATLASFNAISTVKLTGMVAEEVADKAIKAGLKVNRDARGGNKGDLIIIRSALLALKLGLESPFFLGTVKEVKDDGIIIEAVNGKQNAVTLELKYEDLTAWAFQGYIEPMKTTHS